MINELAYFGSMIPSYKNKSINFHGKSTDWFLYDVIICLSWVKNKEMIRFSHSSFKKDTTRKYCKPW